MSGRVKLIDSTLVIVLQMANRKLSVSWRRRKHYGSAESFRPTAAAGHE
jgi:hypothetical protein